MNFRSDNESGAHPTIIKAVSTAFAGGAYAYGADEWTQRVERRLRELFEKPDLVSYPVATGTAANVLSLACCTPSWGAIYCHPQAHVMGDEANATEFYSGGAQLRAIGPQGFFTRAAGEPSLFVGTGTGVTPLRSMIRDALTHGDTSPMTLLFGVRTEADRLYQDELDALAAQHPNLRVLYTLSRPSPTWTGLTGYVQTHVERLYREVEAM